MGLFDQFPYANFHEMNQDWIIKTVKELVGEFAKLKLDWDEMQTWIENYFKNLDIDEEIKKAILDRVQIMSQDGTLDSMISRAIASQIPEYTAPVFVDSTDDMTDPDRIYVLTSDGSIYAYNGTEFYDTGLDYTFDGSGYVSQSGVLANNTDLNSLTGVNTVYYLNSAYTYTHAPYAVSAGTLFIQYAGITTTQIVLTTRGAQHMRYKIGSSAWTDWQAIEYGTGRTLVHQEDLDNITEPGVYTKPGSSAIVVSHLPDGTEQGYLAFVYVFVSGTTVIQTYLSAGVYDYAHFQATRYKTLGGSWSAWKHAAWSSHGVMASGADLDALIDSGWYFFNGTPGITYYNMPEDIPAGSAAFLEVLTFQNVILQRMVKYSDGLIAVRASANAGSTWRNWRTVAGKEVDPGGLTDAKYYAFGDSITLSYVWADGSSTQADYDDRIPTRVGAACNIGNVVNKGVGNIGYLNPVSEQVILDVIEETDISDAALITLAGGRNDGTHALGTSSATSGDGTICGAIRACLEYIKTQNKKCQIVVVQPTPNSSSDGETVFTTRTATGNWSLDDFETQVKALCGKYGAAYVGWRDCSYVWSWSSFSGDRGNYAHPNSSACYAQLGAYLGGQVSKYFRL